METEIDETQSALVGYTLDPVPDDLGALTSKGGEDGIADTDGRRVSDVPKSFSQAYQYARTLIRQASAPPEASKVPPAQPRLPGMTLAEPERTAQEIVARHAQKSAADLRSSAYILEAVLRSGTIPTRQTAEAMEEATRRLRALADQKDRIDGDLPYGLNASGEHAMRRPIYTSEDERNLLREAPDHSCLPGQETSVVAGEQLDARRR